MTMTLDWSCGELAEGMRCYRSEEFFQAHEHWEYVWLRSPEPEKTFLQALIQVTAAFHHLQRNNPIGTASLLRGARRRLESFPADFAGIAVAPLRNEIDTWLQGLAQKDRPCGLAFPRMCQTADRWISADDNE
jgi:predicted metal-dependent hydrolase